MSRHPPTAVGVILALATLAVVCAFGALVWLLRGGR